MSTLDRHQHRAGSIELTCASVDLADVVRAQIDQLRTLEPLRRVEVDLPERLEMFCDEGLMRSLLQTLVGNAWKFTAARDTARIGLTRTQTGNQTVLTVSDNGAGFDTAGMGQLLRPFQRCHAQAQFQDTGLGLVTCQRIAHRHGGRLSVQSTPGAGTRVSVTLPAAPSDPVPPLADPPAEHWLAAVQR